MIRVIYNSKIKCLTNNCIQGYFKSKKNLDSLDFIAPSKDEVDIFNSNREMVSLKVLKSNGKNTESVEKRAKGFVKKYNQIIKKLQFHPLYIESNYKEKHLVKKYVERMIDTQLYGSIKIGVLAVDFLRAQNKENGTALEGFKTK